METNLPKDCQAGAIGRTARAIVHRKFSPVHWDYHEETGSDNGRDCYIELVEDGQWHNHKIEGQIKGTLNPKQLKDEDEFTFSLEARTINYALESPIAFLLLYVTISDETVYYLPLQDYFINHHELFKKLKQGNINVHISLNNVVSDDDRQLQDLAKSVYIGGATAQLRKVQAN